MSSKVRSWIYPGYEGVFDEHLKFGRHPALIVVDMQQAYTEPESPFFSQAVLQSVDSQAALLSEWRARGLPVFFTRVAYEDRDLADGGVFVEKIPALRRLMTGHWATEIVAELERQDDEPIISKKFASAFFGTTLSSILVTRRIDTLILIGCTTSGCVRATAVDGLQHGYRVFIPEECVADRSDDAHFANLTDIQSKYGEVVRLETLINLLPPIGRPAC